MQSHLWRGKTERERESEEVLRGHKVTYRNIERTYRLRQTKKAETRRREDEIGICRGKDGEMNNRMIEKQKDTWRERVQAEFILINK